ncbi:hypothetical protein [Leptospira noguchii]|uniref:Uncharacterized protein n=2 Tax=Leptospira noguchii TaxID=28182 RepID=M6YKG6_9LEPT|nr:hypothetical protein [Leptospira noguchii]EMO90029.1 hypothetical protein LEP1GSC024_2290 [Leptospira noguchii str. 2001034031]
MKNYLIRFKNFLTKHKSFLISRILVFVLLLSFFKINNLEIHLSHNEEHFEKVSPADYSKDRSKLVCYASLTPKEIQNTCDFLDSKKRKVKRNETFSLYSISI